uniref:Uncharacterized protein n=1 Tax=Romanomermis culicivorax TaxID=13658 RepID=A0A915HNR4_ROMCU
MEIVESETKKQDDVEVLVEQIKEMKQKIETFEKKRDETSEEPYIEVVSEVTSKEEENPQLNALPPPPVYTKAGGQSVENITNPEKFAKEENKAELEKVRTGNFQQPATNPKDRVKYRRGLGKCGQALNKALKEGKYVIDYQYRRVSLLSPCVQKYLAHMVPTLDEEVALMTMELINCIYDEAGLEIETIRYYELQFHVMQANLPEKPWNIFEVQLTEWTMTRPPWKKYEAVVWACRCLFIKLSQLGRITQIFTGFYYQAHAFIMMKLQREYNARQAGLGNNYQRLMPVKGSGTSIYYSKGCN